LAADYGIVEGRQRTAIGERQGVSAQLTFELALEGVASEKIYLVAVRQGGAGEVDHVDVAAAHLAGVDAVTQEVDAFIHRSGTGAGYPTCCETVLHGAPAINENRI
jgi:hypothetical protein